MKQGKRDIDDFQLKPIVPGIDRTFHGMMRTKMNFHFLAYESTSQDIPVDGKVIIFKTGMMSSVLKLATV